MVCEIAILVTGPQEAKKDYAQLPLDFLKELREQEASVSKLED